MLLRLCLLCRGWSVIRQAVPDCTVTHKARDCSLWSLEHHARPACPAHLLRADHLVLSGAGNCWHYVKRPWLRGRVWCHSIAAVTCSIMRCFTIMVHGPPSGVTPCFGALGVTQAALLQQIPINARVKALEDAVPGHQQRLGAKGAGLGSPGKDLETRVSLLEDAMQSLLSAQACGPASPAAEIALLCAACWWC